MAEFRIEGISFTGKPVIGIVDAENFRRAKEKAKLVAQQHGFTLTAVRTRQTFKYEVRYGSGRLITGEQKAFTKEQVSGALQKMGFRVVRVTRKLLEL